MRYIRQCLKTRHDIGLELRSLQQRRHNHLSKGRWRIWKKKEQNPGYLGERVEQGQKISHMKESERASMYGRKSLPRHLHSLAQACSM